MKAIVFNLFRALFIFGFGLLAACFDYAYVGMPQGQPSREVKIPDGTTRLISTAARSAGLLTTSKQPRFTYCSSAID